ncbi:MAG: hypothetical protein JSV61_15940, partial [Anaerolineales bacterium]
MNSLDKRVFWLRWVGANAFGEVFGLGATLAVGGYIIAQLKIESQIGFVLVAFSVAVLSGAIEATVVGLAQWWAMHPWLRAISRRAWWQATLVGALLAYLAGYLPSTIMNLGEQTSQTTVAEPAQWIVLLLAGGIGLVAGAVLSLAQWLVLRKHIQRAGWWMPANMLAWLAGMPIIFWGIDTAQKGQPL